MLLGVPGCPPACPAIKLCLITSAAGPHKSAGVHQMKAESLEFLYFQFLKESHELVLCCASGV